VDPVDVLRPTHHRVVLRPDTRPVHLARSRVRRHDRAVPVRLPSVAQFPKVQRERLPRPKLPEAENIRTTFEVDLDRVVAHLRR
jgi:hypothetical protein